MASVLIRSAAKTDKTMKPNITHLAKERRFTTVVDGHEAHVDYVISEGALVVTHTFVPKVLKGRGIASDLVRAAYTFADLNGLRCKATCSYALAWLAQHPGYY